MAPPTQLPKTEDGIHTEKCEGIVTEQEASVKNLSALAYSQSESSSLHGLPHRRNGSG